ncbi:MAG: ferredoxin [Chloroflexi bacterium]|nr:ferredoxin [Chloroflexota bacterium]
MSTERYAQRDQDAMTLRINPILCTAFGFCAEYVPELFTLDDWGYGWVRQSTVSPEQIELARQAAALCPKRAVLLQRSAAPQPSTANSSKK